VKFGGRRPPPAPDADLIRMLAALLGETGLTEIEYAVGDRRLRIARVPGGGAMPAVSRDAAAAAAPQARPIPAPEPPPIAEIDHPGALKAPMVGVAYLSAQPGAPPFVRPGDSVSEGQTLMIIEAMKVMNQISAPRAGRVARIFVEDAEPVEYGAALMLIE
jgi:acetyl-CoA carboxylase biotin carboxyl carrier protein